MIFGSAYGYDATWREFDSVIGSRYLAAIHLNDSKRELGSRVDRHAPLGRGYLGKDFCRMEEPFVIL